MNRKKTTNFVVFFARANFRQCGAFSISSLRTKKAPTRGALSWRRRIYCCKQQSVAPPTGEGKKEAKTRMSLARTSDNAERSQFLPYARKKHPQGVLFRGAEKKIRTSGRVLPVTRFPIVLLKPLRHLCINRYAFPKAPIYITVFFRKKQAFLLNFQKNLEKTYFLRFGLITGTRNSVFHKACVRTLFAYVLR